jgi:hypothetical protein
MSGLSGLSNHWRERSFLIWAALGFFPLAMGSPPDCLGARLRGARLIGQFDPVI